MPARSLAGADRLQLHCSPITAGHLINCHFAGSFSEERGALNFGGAFAVGLQCTGAYCDNLNDFICNLGPRSA